jgi:hypothetical protein
MIQPMALPPALTATGMLAALAAGFRGAFAVVREVPARRG